MHEKSLTLPELSRLTGWRYEELLAATRREVHPLPCTLHGKKRPVARVKPSHFYRWEEEEAYAPKQGAPWNGGSKARGPADGC